MKYILLVLLVLNTSKSYSQTKFSHKYVVDAFMIEDYDSYSKTWKSSEMRDGEGLKFYVVFEPNEPDKIYVYKGDGRTYYTCYNTLNEKIGQDNYVTFATIDSNGKRAEITFVIWADGKTTMDIVYDNRKLYLFLK